MKITLEELSKLVKKKYIDFNITYRHFSVPYTPKTNPIEIFSIK